MSKTTVLGIIAVGFTANLLGQSGSQAQTTSRPGGIGGAIPGQVSTTRLDTRPTTGTGRIGGRVVTAGTNTSLRRVQLSLMPNDASHERRTTFSDPQGLYEFRELPPGKFVLIASKPGYLTLEYGQRRPYERGSSIVLSTGQALSSVNFALPRGSVIAGRVTDELGESMPLVQVQALRFQYSVDGQRRLVVAAGAMTDDRGEFRVFGLMPGEYVVTGRVNPAFVATVPSTVATTLPGASSATNDLRDGYPPTFYPGTSNASEAQSITLGIAEESTINFGLVSARLSRVTGTVRDSEGQPLSGQSIFLLPRNGILDSPIRGTVAADGTFALAGVPPGEFTLNVMRTGALLGKSAAPELASVPIAAAGTDIVGLRLVTSRGAVVKGRVIWDGSSPIPTGARARVAVSPVGESPSAVASGIDPNANGQVDSAGNFEIGGVFGRIVLTTSISGWAIKSVRLDGREIRDVPVDTRGRATIDGLQVTMSDKFSGLTGVVTDAKGAPLTQYVVLVQPTAEMEAVVAARYVRTVRSDTNGRFELRDIRPGRYVATAIEALEEGRQYSPNFRQQLRLGAREFALREGETLTVQLQLNVGF